MTTANPHRPLMPDIARRSLAKPLGKLDWVGMSDIRQPVLIQDGDDVQRVQAAVQVYVDLDDAHAKGIHMSRLYLLLDAHARRLPLTVSSLREMLDALHGSHRDLSTRAFVEFAFDYERGQSALLSEHAGWSSYPVTLTGTLVDGEMRLELGVRVTYSSTCPCSAAFADDATDLPILSLIEALEGALGTPVQTAVKREDEQEFARLNGQNLMFCEDAARKLQQTLNGDDRVADFWVRIEHHESLHAHNAVAIVTKGLTDGYLPLP